MLVMGKLSVYLQMSFRSSNPVLGKIFMPAVLNFQELKWENWKVGLGRKL